MGRPARAWGAQPPERASRPRPRGPDEALREQRPPAAARVDHADAGSGRAQHAQGGLSDAGVEIAGERVGHQDHVGLGGRFWTPAPDRRGRAAPHDAFGERRAQTRDARRARPEGEQIVGVAGQPRGQGHAPGAVAMGERLGLQPRHVHLGRALRGAGLAAQAELERLVQPVVRETALEAPLERRPHQHRAPAGGVALVAEGLVARAHRRAARAAGAVAVAGLAGPDDPALAREVERGAPRAPRRRLHQAQATVERIGRDDHPGVEDPVGIEGALEAGEGGDGGGGTCGGGVRREGVHPRVRPRATRGSPPRGRRPPRPRGERRPRRPARAGR